MSVNRTAQWDLLLNLIITMGGAVIASTRPTNGWDWFIFIIGLLVAGAGTVRATWKDSPTWGK